MPDSKKIKIDDDEIKRIVRPLLDDAIEWNEDKSYERLRASSLYHMQKFGNEREGWSQQVASVVFDTVEWSKPDLVSIFTHPDFFSIKMKDSKRADLMKKVIRYQMFRKQNGAKELRAGIHDALINHNWSMKTCYQERYNLEKQVFDRLTLDQMEKLTADEDMTVLEATEVEEVTPGQINPELYAQAGYQPEAYQPETETFFENVRVAKKVIEYAGPKMECTPQWEFLITPGAKDENSAQLVAHRFVMTLDDIKRGEMTGRYRKGSYDKLKDKVESHPEHPDLTSEIEDLYEHDNLSWIEGETSRVANTKEEKILGSNEMWGYECYVKIDIDNDQLLEDCIVTLVQDEVLQVEESPYEKSVFTSGCIYEVAHRFEGKPLPLVLRDDQVEMTNLKRLFSDATADATYGAIVTDSQDLKENWSDRQPGDVVLDTNYRADSFQEVRPQSPPEVALKAIEMKRTDYERKSGVNSLNSGIDDESYGRTATGTALLQQSGQKMQSFRARVMGDVPEEIIRQFIRINQKFGINITALPDGTQVPQDLFDIDEDFDIEIDVGLSPNNRIVQSQFLQQHQQWLVQFAIPSGAAGIEHAVKTQRRIGVLLDARFDDLMYSDEELESVQKLQKQIQQMQQIIGQMQEQLKRLGQNSAKQQEKIVTADIENATLKKIVNKTTGDLIGLTGDKEKRIESDAENKALRNVITGRTAQSFGTNQNR